MVRVDISFDLLIELMSEDYETEGIIKATKGLPDDAEFVASNYDIDRQVGILFFSHESFEPVLVGNPIPNMSIEHSVDYTPIDLLRDWLFESGTFRINHENDYQEYFAKLADKTWEYVNDD
jgi:hypothetical protein